MTNYNFFTLSPGHGGLAFGNYYLTKGKQSPDGLFKEGAYNREIAQIVTDTKVAGVEFENLAPGPIQIPILSRVKAVRNIIAQHNPKTAGGKVTHIALHCNAMGNGKTWPKAHGFVIFYKPWGKHKHASIRLAKIIANQMIVDGIPIEPRRQYIKPGRFTELLGVNCPAVLFEMGFMTNKSDLKNLIQYQQTIASTIVSACLQFSLYDF